MKDTIQVTNAYHTLRPGRDYEVVKEGYDWFLVRNRGKLIYIFKSLLPKHQKDT